VTIAPTRWTACHLVLLSALLLAGLPPAPAAADVQVDYSTVVGSPPSEWGSNGYSTVEDEALWISRWQEAGLGVIRVQIPQYFLEPVNDDGDPGTVNWGGFLFDTAIPIPPDYTRTVSFSSTFQAMKQAGVTIQLNPVYLSEWLSSNPIPDPYMGFPGEAFSTYPPNNLNEYQEYIYALLYYLVNVVEYPPDRIMLDVINEPDLGCGADPVVPCFWDDWIMTDLVAVVQHSHDAIQAVDDRIRMVGLAECCGTSIVRDLMDNYDGAQYLSGLTYHRYVSSDFSSAISRGTTLQAYGLPVTCNEYGSASYVSDGMNGALWHAYALPLLWRNQVAPLQFPFSENPYSSDPYNSMGLMHDWTGGWTRKPAYWVYANFFGSFPGKELVSIDADTGLDVLAGRSSSGVNAELAVWISNPSGASYTDHPFTIESFPDGDAEVLVFDSLSGTSPVDSFQVVGSPLSFVYTIPSQSVLTLKIVSTPDCDDGIDNDGDGLVDTADPACSSGKPYVPDPTAPREETQCQDGINNDPQQDPDPGLIDFDGGQSIWGECTGQPGGCPANVSDPEGDGVANPDPHCVGRPWKNQEKRAPRRCGLGVEVLLVLPLAWLWRRRRRATP
jgi:hypothetical protein